MQRAIRLKLLPDAGQSSLLFDTATAFVSACNTVVPFVVENRCWNAVALHKLAYGAVRSTGILSQFACQSIRRVAASYKTLRANSGIPKDKPVKAIQYHSPCIVYDARTFGLKADTVSLATSAGRQVVSFRCADRDRLLLNMGAIRQANLVFRQNRWYLHVVVQLPDAVPLSTEKVLGVDVGENNLAATSEGTIHGGGRLKFNRDKYLAHRRRLQSNGSRAAKRKLRAISGREQRHVRHVNHEVSRRIVRQALDTACGEIRMEDLTHIRDRIRAGRKLRSRLHRWAFRQLQDFVAYKATGAGLSVVFVDPAYTSKTCNVCGAIGKRRKHTFLCSCGNRRHADLLGAANIAGFAEPVDSARTAINQSKLTHDAPVKVA